MFKTFFYGYIMADQSIKETQCIINFQILLTHRQKRNSVRHYKWRKRVKIIIFFLANFLQTAKYLNPLECTQIISPIFSKQFKNHPPCDVNSE